MLIKKEVFIIKILKNKEIVCLRYADFGSIDTIAEHQSVINEIGYVWFGKAGSAPKTSRLDEILESKPAYLILKSKVGYFIVEFEEYSLEKPDVTEFPQYYHDHVLSDLHISIWFKLIKIHKVKDSSKMEKIVVRSSKRPVPDVIRYSMASSFYTITTEDIDFL